MEASVAYFSREQIEEFKRHNNVTCPVSGGSWKKSFCSSMRRYYQAVAGDLNEEQTNATRKLMRCLKCEHGGSYV